MAGGEQSGSATENLMPPAQTDADSAVAGLAQDDVVPAGKWLRITEGQHHSICVVTQYDAFHHEHQIASGMSFRMQAVADTAVLLSAQCFLTCGLSTDATVSYCPLDTVTARELPTPATEVLDRWHIPPEANFR